MVKKIKFCPLCGEILSKKWRGVKGKVVCEEHGEIYVDRGV